MKPVFIFAALTLAVINIIDFNKDCSAKSMDILEKTEFINEANLRKAEDSVGWQLNVVNASIATYVASTGELRYIEDMAAARKELFSCCPECPDSAYYNFHAGASVFKANSKETLFQKRQEINRFIRGIPGQEIVYVMIGPPVEHPFIDSLYQIYFQYAFQENY